MIESIVRLGVERVRFTAGLGPEKQCAGCMDWWPLDSEFFQQTGIGNRLQPLCKACNADSAKAVPNTLQMTQIGESQ
ncbi:MAG: hypothetical protein ABSF90_10410 [Syntrophobacteraceae bacterium]|jgi:hypothetical protein